MDSGHCKMFFNCLNLSRYWTTPFQKQKDFKVTLGSPLGVIVNEYVIFHCQFEVWDLLTYPPRESTYITLKSSWDHTADTVTVTESERGKVTYRMVSMIS